MCFMRISFIFAAVFLAAPGPQAAVFHPATVADLIADINTANTNNRNDTIDLSGLTFTLETVDNDDDNEGFNGLPSILPDTAHSLTIRNGTIERDPDATGFRLIRVAPGATLSLEHLTLANGLANDDDIADFPGNGGGSILNAGNLSLKLCSFLNNASSTATIFGDSGGGAIYNLGGIIHSIAKSSFSANESAANFGGAINNNFDITGVLMGVIITIDETTFSENNTAISGGALANFGVINTISDSTFSNNAAGGGGAIHNNSGASITGIINSTLSDNSAVGGEFVSAVGGAISTLGFIGEITNCTISFNNALERGGGISNFAGRIVDLDSTIVAENSSPDGPDISNAGIISSASYCLIGTDSGGHGIVNGVDNNQVGTHASPLNPFLGPLQNNGGRTYTRALLSSSPAIDAGSNPNGLAYDQRATGFHRTVGPQTDIGAYEVQSL